MDADAFFEGQAKLLANALGHASACIRLHDGVVHRGGM